MALKLIQRDGILYASGSVKRLHDGKMIRIRKSTTYPVRQRKEAEQERIRIEYQAIHASPAVFGSKDASATIAQGITEYLSRRDVGKSTTDNLLRWASWVGEDILLSELNAELIMRPFDEAMDEERMTGGTVRRYLNDICAMIEVCRQRKLPIPVDLKLQKPADNEARDRWLTVEERDLLIACSDECIRDAVMFLFFTGARPGEMYRLTARDVLHGNQVVFVTYKGKPRKKRIRSVPLNGTIREMVLARAEVAKTSASGLIFPSTTDKKWFQATFYYYWKEAVARTKLEDVRLYDCRSTFASHLIQNGTNLRGVADLLGHSGLNMVMRYAYLGPSHLADAIDTLAGFTDTRKEKNTTQHGTILTHTLNSGVDEADAPEPEGGCNPSNTGLSEDVMRLMMVPHDMFRGGVVHP